MRTVRGWEVGDLVSMGRCGQRTTVEVANLEQRPSIFACQFVEIRADIHLPYKNRNVIFVYN